MSESDFSFESCTHNEETGVSETGRLSFGETSLIPAPYSFEPSDIESDSFLENSSDDSDYNRLSDLSR